jgi:hypothetical protein
LGDIATHSGDVVHSARLTRCGPRKEHDKFGITSLIANFDNPLLVLLNVTILHAFLNYFFSAGVSFPCGAEHLASVILDIALLRLHMKIIPRQVNLPRVAQGHLPDLKSIMPYGPSQLISQIIAILTNCQTCCELQPLRKRAHDKIAFEIGRADLTEAGGSN